MRGGTILFLRRIRIPYGRDRMNRAKRILTGAADFLDLPADILAGLPKMEIIGFREFSIEPHHGLLEYDKECIGIKSDLGRICVLGADLTIKLMNSRRISICGKLMSIELREGADA